VRRDEAEGLDRELTGILDHLINPRSQSSHHWRENLERSCYSILYLCHILIGYMNIFLVARKFNSVYDIKVSQPCCPCLSNGHSECFDSRS
jgi:hypothetical protein